MGKATRWFKALFGLKKHTHNTISNSNSTESKPWMIKYDQKSDTHAIAVAAATAAVADAAVAAAQAAVEVVKLTSQSRVRGIGPFNAAMKIQTVFRGYLARKARRALRALVKLQALVRGFLVRKRAAATLRSMQALFRAQVAVRSQRARRAVNGSDRFYPDVRARRSIESLDEKSELQVKRILSASQDRSLTGSENSPKIVEIDTCKPKTMSRRTDFSLPEYGSDHYYQVLPSPHPCPFPACLSSAKCHHFEDDYTSIPQDSKFATAHNTPRLAFPFRVDAKSACDDHSLFEVFPNSPSYMANTQSFKAKLRPHSAPKQRPEFTKRRLSLSEIVSARTSFSGGRMRRSCSQVKEGS